MYNQHRTCLLSKGNLNFFYRTSSLCILQFPSCLTHYLVWGLGSVYRLDFRISHTRSRRRRKVSSSHGTQMVRFGFVALTMIDSSGSSFSSHRRRPTRRPSTMRTATPHPPQQQQIIDHQVLCVVTVFITGTILTTTAATIGHFIELILLAIPIHNKNKNKNNAETVAIAIINNISDSTAKKCCHDCQSFFILETATPTTTATTQVPISVTTNNNSLAVSSSSSVQIFQKGP